MTDSPKIPVPALVLGIGGLIPFWATAVMSAYQAFLGRSPATEEFLFTIYAGLIISFLGGVRWGADIVRQDTPRQNTLVLSVLPSILGLAAVIVHWAGQPLTGWAMLLAGLALLFRWDRLAVRAQTLPGWYGRLRLILTAGAGLSLLVMTGLYLARA